MPMLLLVDGSSYLYRAFHALPDLRNKAGEPTGAIYGVLNMLRRLESDYKAEGVTYKAVVFDAKGKTFRDDWYPEYKAQRPPMPTDLVAQIEPLHAAIKASGWPLLMEEGVEADDVIGTLARQAEAAGMDVVISTGDKDLTQLVSPRVRWVNTMSNEVLDEAGVTAKFGVEPGRIVDYLALIGDTVDNVPGVAKVGPKTALKWLEQYGTLDNIMANAEAIGGVVGNNLRQALDFLPLGRKLVTVVCDLPLPETPASLAPRPLDKAALEEIFSRYEFKTWLRELQGEGAAAGDAETAGDAATAAPAAPAGAHRQHYETILTWEAFERWLAKIQAAPLVALDTETTSLDPLSARIVGISFALTPGEAAYIPVAHNYPGAPDQLPREQVLARLKPWLEASNQAKLGQNLKYDQHVFANHDIALKGIVHDTLLQSYVLESDKGHDLEQLARRHLGLETIPYTALCGKGAKQIGFDQVAIDQAAEYSAEDSDLTLRVHQNLFPAIAADAKLNCIYSDIEMPAREVLFAMERHGVLIDSGLLQAQSNELGASWWSWKPRPWRSPASPSTSIHPSSWRKSCSPSWACRW